MKPKAGDKVKVTTSDGVFEGILLPRPELLSDDITVIKLTTGYNMGIESKKIKSIELLESFKEKPSKKDEIKKNSKLPTVAILSTGGTIASRIDYRTGGVYADYDASDFVAMCPKLKDVANIISVPVMSMMSEDAMSSDWVKIANAVIKVLPEVDGVVITHGTDTMHFTSAALSFLLKDLSKPVIITGAQRSIDRGSSDAFDNLQCAVIAAARWNGACVATCMHATSSDSFCYLIRGTKVRKMHTTRRDAFRPINDFPLAKVYPDGKIESVQNCPPRSHSKTSVRSMSSDVALVYAYPDMDPGIIGYHVKEGAKAIVIAGTALGHVPLNNKKSLEPELQKAIKKGVHVFICSQTIYGRANPYVYTNLRKLSVGLGAVYLEDMLPEVAYAKAMVALKEKNPVEFMTQSVAGEITSSEDPRTFLL